MKITLQIFTFCFSILRLYLVKISDQLLDSIGNKQKLRMKITLQIFTFCFSILRLYLVKISGHPARLSSGSHVLNLSSNPSHLIRYSIFPPFFSLCSHISSTYQIFYIYFIGVHFYIKIIRSFFKVFNVFYLLNKKLCIN